MMQNNSSAQGKKPFFQRYKIHIAATGFAILIWFLVVSNEFYDAEIQIPIDIPAVQSHYIITSELPTRARVKVRGQGMALMAFMLFREGRLEMNLEWGPGERVLYPRTQDVILGGGAHALTVLQLIEPQEIPVVIEELASRIVPVASQITVKPMPGYTVVGDVLLEPTEVVARGPNSLIKSLRTVPTIERTLDRAKTALSGEILLNSPDAKKIMLQPARVLFKVDVQKLMEKRIEHIPVRVRNLPPGYRAMVLPATLSLIAEGGVTVISALTEKEITAYIDYGRQPQTDGQNAPAYIVPVPGVRYRDIMPKRFKVILERE
ncbi:MAG TPA: CdaR family protein [bacterium]|nr:CdaR family protein [bacterium]